MSQARSASQEDLEADEAMPLVDRSQQINFNVKAQRGLVVAVGLSFLILLAGVVDLIVIARQKPAARIDSVQLSLASSASGDANIKVHGQFGSYSTIHSVDMANSLCQVKYNEDGSSMIWQDVVKVKGRNHHTHHDTSELSFDFDETKFSTMRRLLSATAFSSPIGASIDCNIDLNVNLYRLVPVPVKIQMTATVLAPSNIVSLQVDTSGYAAGRTLFEMSSQSEFNRSSLSSQNMVDSFRNSHLHNFGFRSWSDAVKSMVNASRPQELHFEANVKNPFLSSDAEQNPPFPSFLVSFPAMSLAYTSLADLANNGRYVLSTSPFSVDFMKEKLHLDTLLKLQCSDSLDDASDQSALARCNILDANTWNSFLQNFFSNRVHLAVDSVGNRNFVSGLMGEHHSLQLSFANASTVRNAYSRHVAPKKRALTREEPKKALVLKEIVEDMQMDFMGIHMEVDGTCISFNADNALSGFGCCHTKRGEQMFEFVMFGENGVVMEAMMLNMWADVETVEIQSSTRLFVSEGNHFHWNSTISESQREVNSVFSYDQYFEEKAHIEASLEWMFDADFENDANFLRLDVHSTDTVVLNDDLHLHSDLTFDDEQGIFHTTLNSFFELGTAMTYDFGNDSTKWFLSIPETFLHIDGENVATAKIMMSLNTLHELGLLAELRDGNGTLHLGTENSVMWSDSHLFDREIHLMMASRTNFTDVADWSVISSLDYVDERFNMFLANEDGEGKEIFHVQSTGSYHSEFSQWFLNVNNASLFVGAQGEKIGSIGSQVNYVFNHHNDSSIVSFAMEILDQKDAKIVGTDSAVMFAKPSHATWAEAGIIQVSSFFDSNAADFKPRNDTQRNETLPLASRRPLSMRLQAGALCTDSTTELDLSFQGLTEVPDLSACTHLQILNLEGNPFGVLPASLFDLVELVELNLRNTNLSELSNKVDHLLALESLYLQDNHLTTLPEEIGDMLALLEINLDNNELTSLPPSLGSVQTLQLLSVRNNKLMDLPYQFSGLSNLLFAYLSNNQFSYLPDCMRWWGLLRELDITHNFISYYPNWLFSYADLEHLYYDGQPNLSCDNTTTYLDLSYRGFYTFTLPSFVGCQNLRILKMGGNHIEELPDDLFTLRNLTELYLEYNEIYDLPTYIEALSDLNILDLSNNHLATLPDEIGGLSDLVTLKLDGNWLTALPYSIGGLTSLTYLSARYNRIEFIPVEIGHLLSLQSLYLPGNQLTTLPAEIGQLSSLYTLDIGSNYQFHDLPNEIVQLGSLRNFYAGSCQIYVLPNDFGNLTNLNQFVIDGNELSTLPSSIGQLTNLWYISIGSNNLVALPDEIGQLTGLYYFYAYSNLIKELPPSFVNLVSLYNLELSNNQISWLPRDIGLLTQLRSFYVGNNNLSVIPDSIGNCTYMYSFSAYSNRLKHLPESFYELTYMQYLYLQNNNLQSVSPSFGQMASLYQLDLSYNNISSLPMEMGTMVQLRYLTLSNNAFTTFPDVVGNFTSLISLYFTYNSLVDVSPSIGQLTSLQYLSLYGNMIQSIPLEVMHLVNLYSLDISQNYMTDFPVAVFLIPNLRYFYARQNLFEHLPAEVDLWANNIEYIDLASNRLIHLPDQLQNLTRVHYLSFYNNRLVDLPMSLLNIQTSYVTVDVSWNQISYIPQEFFMRPGLYLYAWGNPYYYHDDDHYHHYYNDDNDDGSSGFLFDFFMLFARGWDMNLDLSYGNHSYNMFFHETPLRGPGLGSIALMGNGSYMQHGDHGWHVSVNEGQLYVEESFVLGLTGFAVANKLPSPSGDWYNVFVDGRVVDNTWNNVFEMNSTSELHLVAPPGTPCEIITAANSSITDLIAKLDFSGHEYFFEAVGFDGEYHRAFSLPDFIPNFCHHPHVNVHPPEPTFTPTTEPTAEPFAVPTLTPSNAPPTKTPTTLPTLAAGETYSPSAYPTQTPTLTPVVEPTPSPTAVPTQKPSTIPTEAPTREPTAKPSPAPSKNPTAYPSFTPTASPTTATPSFQPSTGSPTTMKPSAIPTLRPSAAPSTSAPTLNANAPVISSISTGVTKTSVTLTVTFSDTAVYAGTVTCAAFSSSTSVTTLQQLFTAVSSQSIGYSAGDSSAVVTVGGLSAVNTYKVYCGTRTINGVSSVLADALATLKTVTTACCKGVSFTNAPAFVYGDVTMYGSKVSQNSYVFSYSLSAAPSDTVVVTPVITFASNGSLANMVTATKSSVSFASSATNVGGKFFLSAPATFGETVDVTLVPSGASASEYSQNVTWQVSILSSSTPKPPPAFSVAKFGNGGGTITLGFDSATNKASLSGSFSCSQLFTFTDSSSSTCSWVTSSTVRAILPSASTLSVGDTITLTAGLIKAECSQGQDCSAYTTASAQSVYLSGPDVPLIPTVLLSTPSTVSSCDNVTIDPSLSTGSGGRAWTSAVWTVVRADALGLVSAPSVLNALTSRGVDISSPITISRTLFTPSQYTVTLTLTNFFGSSASATTIFNIDQNPNLPIVSILGSSEITMTPKDALSIYTTTTQASCAEKSSTISYKWTIKQNGNTISKPSISASPSRFSLLPYSLQAGNVYTLVMEATAKATANTAAITGHTSATVKVVNGAVVVVVVGGYKRQVPAVGQMTIDASPSYDENVQSTQSSTLTFSWTCTYSSPSRFGESCASVLPTAKTSKTLVVDATLLEGGSLYDFQVLVKATDGRSSFAVVTVQAQAGGSTTYTSINSLITKVNPESRIGLNGVVRATYGLDCSWTAYVDGVNVPFTALTPTTDTFTRVAVRNDFTYSLIAAGNSFTAGSIVTFRLGANFAGNSSRYGASSEVTININAPPEGGALLINPESGLALSTMFGFSSAGWTDDPEDFPLTYQFVYRTLPTSAPMNIQSRSPSNKASANLPAGSDAYSNAIAITCNVFDAQSAQTTVSSSATVTENDNLDVAEYMNSQLSSFQSVGDVNTVGQLIANVGNTLKKVNCSLATASYCASKNRGPCSKTPQTCSSCLDGYTGALGDGNSKCFSNSRRRLDAAEVGAACSVDDDCLFGKCGDAGLCVAPLKLCPSNTAEECSGHGHCTYSSRSGALLSTACSVTDFECTAQCVCDSGYGGQGCNLDETRLASQDQIRSTLCSSVITVGNNSDVSVQLLESLFGYLDSAFDPHEVYTEESKATCRKAATFVVQLLSDNRDLISDIDSSKLENLMSTVSNYIVSNKNATTEDSLFIHDLVGQLNDAILSSMVNGQAPFSYATSNMRTLITKAKIGEATSLAPPATDEEIYYGNGVANDASSDARLGSHIYVANTSTSSYLANSDGYLSLVIMTWGVNPFPEAASAVKSTMLRVENHNSHSQARRRLVDEEEAALLSTTHLRTAAAVDIPSTPETQASGLNTVDYYIVLQLDEPHHFDQRFTIEEAKSRGLNNITFPACTNFDGETYTTCDGCWVSTYNDHNVTFACNAEEVQLSQARRRLTTSSSSSSTQQVATTYTTAANLSDDDGQSSSSSDKKNQAGMIAGAVIGSVVGFILLVLLALYIRQALAAPSAKVVPSAPMHQQQVQVVPYGGQQQHV